MLEKVGSELMHTKDWYRSLNGDVFVWQDAVGAPQGFQVSCRYLTANGTVEAWAGFDHGALRFGFVNLNETSPAEQHPQSAVITVTEARRTEIRAQLMGFLSREGEGLPAPLLAFVKNKLQGGPAPR